jgi:hypothetical protein
MSCDAFFLGSVQDILSGGLFIWRAVVSLMFFLFTFVFGGLDQPLFATRWSCHFCFEILISFYRYVIYDLEGSNNVDPLVSGFSQIYLTVKYI